MKAITVMFDSLNRRMLPPYGCDWVQAPNFRRLADRAVTFDNCYLASAPCMPARRDLHTGRYSFLHRFWGPIEPFDDSMPEILQQHGVHTHLVSDHYHYWADGGATYHTRYSTWENVRGQEGDRWKGEVDPHGVLPTPPSHGERARRQDQINRGYLQREEDRPLAQTFARGLEFIRTNHHADRWFLHIEAFDPHEPFFVPQRYLDLYPHADTGAHSDWPAAGRVQEPPEEVQRIRYAYAALVSMCDAYLGRVLDVMDELNLWQDTLLIVNTDHGMLLGEHGWWAKNSMPFYNEVAHIPLFIWDPRSQKRGERRTGLVQMIDIAPTLLEFFGVARPQDMQGVPLRGAIEGDAPVRQAALFGIFGGHVNCTDGRYVYMRSCAQPDNGPLYQYGLMPTTIGQRFDVETLRAAELASPFKFTKGCPTLRMPVDKRFRHFLSPSQFGTLLFDLQSDPCQDHPLAAPEIEEKMIGHLVELMLANDAPREQFERLGLSDRVSHVSS